MIRNEAINSWYRHTRDKRRNRITKIMGVEYAHIHPKNGEDLYVTAHGVPFIQNLDPDNFWTDKEWFRANSTRLSGTSAAYRIKTKMIGGRDKDIVVKWNRMGQDIPGDEGFNELAHAEFNSPFEEISLVTDLRNEMYRSPSPRVIQKPLAIYVPAETTELERSGRREHRMADKIRAHDEVELDMHRAYAVIYEWIDGMDAVEAFQAGIIDRNHMTSLANDAEERLRALGFVVGDNKPHHVIVRPHNGVLAKDRQDRDIYAMIDFELLQRTPKQERKVRKAKRAEYLKRQRDRFAVSPTGETHPHLSHVRILGVDYVYGHVASTKGRLWVVGKDTHLFDYFLPERWEHTPKTKISVYSDMYHTMTKDNIHLVWKMSRVGLRPDMDPFKKDEHDLLNHGHNSPFEEVSLAIELSKKNVASIYPRAIYMSGRDISIQKHMFDESRYASHQGWHTPDGIPVLRRKRDYITIWGYWNGPDEKLAAKDSDYYEGIDALRAYREGMITEKQYLKLLEVTRRRLMSAGVRDLNLRGNHILISCDSNGKIIETTTGRIDTRICNFEFLERVHRRR